jgi:GMP synthase-like glutamine amidotransferase
VPFLGICLGAQQLASVRGGSVVDRPGPAVGWMPISLVGRDPLFEGVPREFMALEWHAQSFTIGGHARHLALRRGDVGDQAFCAGRRAWGLQFHPDIDAATLEVWLKRDNKGTRERAPHVLAQQHERRDEIAMSSGRLCSRLVRNLLHTADQPDAA